MTARPWRHGRAALQRLPLRLRLVAGFSAAITVVLLAAGAFVYWRVSYALDLRLDTDLADAAEALTPLVTAGGALRTDRSITGTPIGRLYQVLDSTGHVLSSGADLGPGAVIPPALTAAARRTTVRLDVGSMLPPSPRPIRFLALPVPPGIRGSTPGTPAVLVVGIRRDRRDEALRELMAQLGIAGIGALLISAVVGERLSKAALAPVERYRTQAAAIAGGASGVRLDVPPGRDDEVTRLGTTLNGMLQALEETVDREKRFAAEASHELRTPLTLLSTRIQLARSRARTVAEYQDTLAELNRDVAELVSLAGSLLDLAAVTSAPVSSPITVTAVREGLRSIVASGPAAGASLIDDLLDGSPFPDATVPLSVARLRQVLTNLLANAVVHGRPPVTVTLDVPLDAAGPPVLRITVTDHGSGPSADFLPHAAERFARADDARDRAGAGLGLALVNAVLEPVGGELRLCAHGIHQRYGHHTGAPCDHADRGTTATVMLPITLAPTTATAGTAGTS